MLDYTKQPYWCVSHAKAEPITTDAFTGCSGKSDYNHVAGFEVTLISQEVCYYKKSCVYMPHVT